MSRNQTIVETERLTIRRLVDTDVPALAALWTDQHVTRFMGGPRVFAEVSAALKSDLAVPPQPLDLWPVVERISQSLVGHCGLMPKIVADREEIELVYVIAHQSWGRGYATEAAIALRDHAFHSLRVSRLISLIDPSNAASERVALKIGMTREGDTLRPSGKTMLVYVITRVQDQR